MACFFALQDIVWIRQLLKDFSLERYHPTRRAPPPCIQSLLDVLTQWHGKETVFICKILSSDDTYFQQDMHRDRPGAFEECKERRKKRQRTKLLYADYSLIVATKRSRCSPTKLVTCSGDITISRGHVALWSGECLHAGASYDVLHRRLFIAITSRKTAHMLEYVEHIVEV